VKEEKHVRIEKVRERLGEREEEKVERNRDNAQ
jgi:hypothetical protein